MKTCSWSSFAYLAPKFGNLLSVGAVRVSACCECRGTNMHFSRARESIPINFEDSNPEKMIHFNLSLPRFRRLLFIPVCFARLSQVVQINVSESNFEADAAFVIVSSSSIDSVHDAGTHQRQPDGCRSVGHSVPRVEDILRSLPGTPRGEYNPG